MATFVPFNGKGLVHFNSVGDGYQCNFCVKSFKTFEQYEAHWPKCTGICKERAFRAFDVPPYPHFPSSFNNSSSSTNKQATKKVTSADTQATKSTSADTQATKNTSAESQTPKSNSNKNDSNASGNTNSNASGNTNSNASGNTNSNASGNTNSNASGNTSNNNNKGKGKNKKK
ncbi:hypothetical protein GGI23_003734 [Coemansia sp. RSA 2559]|nr:hypothetical protein GGI23_003734 [Coemansia sp. RSA 2559]KAJ2857562.1 hypothetical protein GGI22_003487 [Coemansia erecta]